MSDMDEPLSSDDISSSAGKVKSMSASEEEEKDNGEESDKREINKTAGTLSQPSSVQSVSDVLGMYSFAKFECKTWGGLGYIQPLVNYSC